VLGRPSFYHKELPMQIICTLAGAQFRPAEAKEALRTAGIGDVVSLEPDPENEYDPQAVKVIFNGHHIGFIPKQSNPPVFAALQAEEEVSVSIIAFEAPLRPVLEVSL
jgi:hypothetical protein